MKIIVYNTMCEYAMTVRKKVFVQEQGFHDEFDETDASAFHLVMFHDKEPIATCRVFESSQKGVYIIGRLAVLKEYRGRNYGADMVKEAVSLVLEKGGYAVSLHAQCRVKEFYNKLGFQEFGTVEEEEGCPHVWMKKMLFEV